MSMLTLNGKVVNVYESPKGLNKTTGEAYGGQHRIQLMCENTLKNGELKIELIDLTVDSIQEYSDKRDQIVSVPVGVYVSSNKVAFYALK
jgi:hypothetical protein